MEVGVYGEEISFLYFCYMVLCYFVCDDVVGNCFYIR